MIYVLSKHKKNIKICHLKINIFTAVTYRNILYGHVIGMHVETANRYMTFTDPENFLEGGGSPFRPGWVQLHTSRVVINLSKWVDHGTDSYFWYIQRPEQDLMILINLSPQILRLLRLYFSLSREKMMVGPGLNCFGSVWSSFVTLLSAQCAFLQGSNLGFHVARLY